MRKIKEVIRLQAAGLSQHQIARACRISQSTVHAYLKAAEAAGLSWPLPEFATLRQQLQQHRHLTLFQLWQEYREAHPEMGYRSCLGILRLSKQYERARVEAAARRAVALGACSYQSLKSILERQLDRLPLEPP